MNQHLSHLLEYLKPKCSNENMSTEETAGMSKSSSQIKEMMFKAKNDVKLRKEKTEKLKSSIMGTKFFGVSSEEKQKKIDEFRMRIQAEFSTQSASLPGPKAFSAPTRQHRFLMLNHEGRTVDSAGREIIIKAQEPTLKVNFHLQQKEEDSKTEINRQFYDQKLRSRPIIRTKRELRFHELGNFQTITERKRLKNRLEALQNKISSIAQKTGLSSLIVTALSRSDNQSEKVPIYEWWDSVILVKNLDTFIDGKIAVNYELITNLIEHPIQTQPPNELKRLTFDPVFLTKQEQKKLRRQNRRASWMAEQEKIRLGLVDPPKAKLKISNMIQVLSIKGIQDPTKTEAEVRMQMAIRRKVHETSNETLKLNTQRRREKNIKKLRKDVSIGIHVSVYLVRDLHKAHAKKFKVEINAKQLYMSGVIAMFHDLSVVVVEGGPKQQKRYRQLMMHRIKWHKEKNVYHSNDKCILIWEGKILSRNFGEFKSRTFMNEIEARKFFQNHHCEHYWDLAYSTSV